MIEVFQVSRIYRQDYYKMKKKSAANSDGALINWLRRARIELEFQVS
jgi:hypothetical protein